MSRTLRGIAIDHEGTGSTPWAIRRSRSSRGRATCCGSGRPASPAECVAVGRGRPGLGRSVAARSRSSTRRVSWPTPGAIPRPARPGDGDRTLAGRRTCSSPTPPPAGFVATTGRGRSSTTSATSTARVVSTFPTAWSISPIDGEGILHVANPGMHRVERYKADGELLGHFGRFDGRDPAGLSGLLQPDEPDPRRRRPGDRQREGGAAGQGLRAPRGSCSRWWPTTCSTPAPRTWTWPSTPAAASTSPTPSGARDLRLPASRLPGGGAVMQEVHPTREMLGHAARGAALVGLGGTAGLLCPEGEQDRTPG